MMDIYFLKNAKRLLKKFNIYNFNNCSTPMNAEEKNIDDKTTKVNESYFHSIADNLMYSWSNILFAIGLPSKFMHSPTVHDLHQLGSIKKILCYI